MYAINIWKYSDIKLYFIVDISNVTKFKTVLYTKTTAVHRNDKNIKLTLKEETRLLTTGVKYCIIQQVILLSSLHFILLDCLDLENSSTVQCLKNLH